MAPEKAPVKHLQYIQAAFKSNVQPTDGCGCRVGVWAHGFLDGFLDGILDGILDGFRVYLRRGFLDGFIDGFLDGPLDGFFGFRKNHCEP